MAPSAPSPLPKAKSPDGCRRILDAAQNVPWHHPFDRAAATAVLATALYAGLLRKELLGLKFLDVDLAARVVRVKAGNGMPHGGSS